MEVSGADVVKAANGGFFLERRCCRTTSDFVMQGLRDDVVRGVTRVANSARGIGVGVLDAVVSASMIAKQEVLADQQHGEVTRHTCEQRPRRRRLKDASAGAIAWRARQGADAREWQPRYKRARPQRQTVTNTKEQEHASNDVQSRDAEQCEGSDARHLLSLTFAATTSSVIPMT